jgi:hypothetical protein
MTNDDDDAFLRPHKHFFWGSWKISVTGSHLLQRRKIPTKKSGFFFVGKITENDDKMFGNGK